MRRNNEAIYPWTAYQCTLRRIKYYCNQMQYNRPNVVYAWNRSQAARPGLAVLMASAVVALKHETSTLPKVTILFQSIWHLAWVITLGRSPALLNLVRIRWAVETPRGVNIYGYCDFFVFLFLYSSPELQPIPVNQLSRTIPQKTRSGVRKTILGMRYA